MKIIPMQLYKDHKVLIVDDFLELPLHVRSVGICSPYTDWTGADLEVYKRICVTKVEGLDQSLEKVVGPFDMLGQAYRLNYSGEMPNCSIHTDVGWGTHALVLYLSGGPSGTAFWKHKSSGSIEMEPGDINTLIKVKKDTENESKWEQTGFIAMKFNRAAIYSSNLFHSRYPFAAFGDSPMTGRLTAVAFFTPESDEVFK